MATRTIRTKTDLDLLYPVPGFETFYEINAAGNVRSLPRRVNSPAAGGTRLIPARVISVHLVKGYPAFIAAVGGVKHTAYVHRALARLFIPNPDNKPHINHIDGDKANFALGNLEWCTHLENMRHAYATGLATAPVVGPGEASPASKLTDAKVREIKRLLRAGETLKSIATRFGVVNGTIGFIASGATWSHIE